jgi:hypothetical protein
MKFIIMHKTNAHYEAGGGPSPELVARVGAMIGDMVRGGVLQGGEGLRPSSEGVRLTFAAGQRSVTRGPFQGQNELPAGFSILRTPSIEDAIEHATELADAVGPQRAVEFDIRPVNEPWDIGMAEKPASVTTHRYMVLRKATAETEAGVPPSPAQQTRLAGLIEDATRSGIHLVAATMQPSRRGRRLKNERNGVVIIDGPFAETKELLGGYVIVSVASLNEATRWAERYISVVDTDEVDILELE